MKNKIFVGLSVIFLFAVCLYAVNLKYEQKKQESYETKLYKNFCDTQKEELKQAEYSKKYNIYKEIDFSSDKKPAKEIFQNFILKNENLTLEEYKKLCDEGSSFCYSKVNETDLNNDGVSEIIGYNKAYCNLGLSECRGFILQKKKNEWVKISEFNFIPALEIDILQTKNGGFFDIRPNSKFEKNSPFEKYWNKTYIMTYKNGNYENYVYIK